MTDQARLPTTSWSALVTGGGSGLGRATAVELLQRGAHVVVADLDSPAARSTTSADGTHLVATDVRDEHQLAAAISAAAAVAPLRVLVACAGIGASGRVLGRGGSPMELRDWDHTLGVNLTGTFNAVRLAAAAMAANEIVDGDRGSIVMTASVAAFDGQVGQVPYSASKAAIAGMTLPLARELADFAIRVVTIAPGMFDTALLAGLPTPAITSLSRQVPHPSRLGYPSEFAHLVGAIVENHLLNGEVIRLDGALRMAPR